MLIIYDNYCRHVAGVFTLIQTLSYDTDHTGRMILIKSLYVTHQFDTNYKFIISGHLSITMFLSVWYDYILFYLNIGITILIWHLQKAIIITSYSLSHSILSLRK